MVEVFSLEERDGKTRIYVKGWVHASDYKIVIKHKGHIILDSVPYISRYDINKAFHEKIEDNTYGFEMDNVLSGKIKQADIYLVIDEKEEKIASLDKRKLNRLMEKQRKILSTIKRAILLFWREYHFLVPPTMLKKYWKDFRKKSKQIQEGLQTYNPLVPLEYQAWLKEEDKVIPNIKFPLSVVIEKKNERLEEEIKKNLGSTIYYWNQKEKWLGKIKSDYVCFMDDNVMLLPSFWMEVSSFLKKEEGIDLLYTDYDEINDKKERVRPHLSPDWSFDTLLGANYIGPLFIVNKKYLNVFKDEGWNLYLMLLLLRDKVKKVFHISHILYSITKKKQDSYKTIQTYCKRNKMKIDMEKVRDDAVIVSYPLEENPLISIIIPTKDHVELLKRCIDSIVEKSTYHNYEIIVIDNNSEKKETFDYFKKELKRNKKVRLEHLECPFNYSYINNVAIRKYAKGEYIVLLNNDTEIITPNWLERMLGYAIQKEIGTVGVKLIFEDETIQHAGIIMGKGGLAGHAHYGKPRRYEGIGYELTIPYNVSASTAACLMFSKAKWSEVGGLEEQLQVAFNDVDFNLKLLEKGYRNIFLPNVEVYHYESKSRGLDTTVEKQKRFMQEWQFMEDRWQDIIKYDPYYNRNYSKDFDYQLERKENVS